MDQPAPAPAFSGRPHPFRSGGKAEAVQDRRTILHAGAGLAAATLLPACVSGNCDSADGINARPSANGTCRLNSEPHERTLMQWPVSLDVYDRKLAGAAFSGPLPRSRTRLPDMNPS